MLVACTSKLDAELAHVRFLEEPTVFDGETFRGPGKIEAQGWLAARVSSSQNILKAIEKNGHNAAVKAKYCDNEVFLGTSGWPLDAKRTDVGYEYTTLIKPKEDYSDINRDAYDLTESPTDVCVKIFAQIMDPFKKIETEWVKVPITKELIEEIEAFEAAGGEASSVVVEAE